MPSVTHLGVLLEASGLTIGTNAFGLCSREEAIFIHINLGRHRAGLEPRSGRRSLKKKKMEKKNQEKAEAIGSKINVNIGNEREEK